MEGVDLAAAVLWDVEKREERRRERVGGPLFKLFFSARKFSSHRFVCVYPPYYEVVDVL